MNRAVVGGLVTGVLVAGLWAGLVPMVIRSMTPKVTFAESTPPRAPDYREDAAWSALPGRADAADVAPEALPAGDQETAPADVFYIHPTSYVGGQWQGPVDDPKVNEATVRGGVLIQASAFNAVGAIYAPEYRQANGSAFVDATADSDAAIGAAYQDVKLAFHEFLRRRGADRPFILAAHSQGSVLGARLLAEEIAPTPLAAKLVGAWLVGTSLTVDTLARDAPDVPPCASPTQTGCVVAYNARSPDYQPVGMDPRPLTGSAGGEAICVNPITGKTGGGAEVTGTGAVFFDRPAPERLAGFVSARCAGGVLVTTLHGKPPRDLMSWILDHVMGRGNYHPMEYQLFWEDIRRNAKARAAAWRATSG